MNPIEAALPEAVEVTNADLHRLRERAVPRGVSNLLGVYAARARNAEIWDVEGRRYVDFAAGIAVLNTGHLHPAVHAAAAGQLEAFSHACFQVTPYESYVRLADRLNRLAPGATPKKTIFLTTGAEAVENAVKIARAYTKRSAVLAFAGGFHGRTLYTSGLTGKVFPYKAGFGPLPGEIYHLPFPADYLGVTPEQAFAALDHVFKADVEPERVSALIIEPVQGEGGFYVAPREFLRKLREICDKHGIVMIVDEIQTGFARTGRMFAIEHAGVEPDLMTLAKSLAGGFPLSAVVGKAAIMDAPGPGGLGGTYAGSPLACSAGLAVLDVIERESLCARAESIGRRLRAALEAQRKAPGGERIGEIRGLGAMVAFELVHNADPTQPDAETTSALTKRAGSNGLVLLSCGVRGNVIRLLPPLTISDALLDEGLGILRRSLLEVTTAQPVA